MQPAVLLVERDETARTNLHQTLEEAGYAVTEAADGAAALALLQLNLTRKRPHRLVVLLGPALPTMDAAEVLRSIAADPHLASHHAYVVFTPSEGPVFLPAEQALPNLSIVAMAQPISPAALLEAVAHAAGGLGLGSEGTGRRD